MKTWDQETFEEYVETVLISSFERRLSKNRHAPLNSLSDNDLNFYRQFPPYIPGLDREILNELEIDVINDGFNDKACLVLPGGFQGEETDDYYKGYSSAVTIKRVDKIKGRHFIRTSAGRDYKMSIFTFKNNSIKGYYSYITVDKNGSIYPFDEQVMNGRGYSPGFKREILSLLSIEPHIIRQRMSIFSYAMQFYSDKKFIWTITAREDNAAVEIGCSDNEVKSLLYARDTPLTKTGRKRPILHLVNSHHRRIKSGIEIDIKEYLRGISTVIIKNTEFTVKPPDIFLNKI